MATYLLWAIAGFVLIIAELVTGTFYLLVIGVAALVGALVAFLGGAFWLQALSAGAATLIGVYLAHRWLKKSPKKINTENSLEVGQTVVFEHWVDEASGAARVKYRGASWDAKVTGSTKPGDTLTIRALQQGVLQVGP